MGGFQLLQKINLKHDAIDLLFDYGTIILEIKKYI